MRILTLISILLFCVPCAYAAPTVSGVSGTVGHNNSITISGTDFGTKATAAPLKFDDFEDGTLSAQVATEGFWTQQTDDNTYFTTARTRANSTQTIIHHVVYGTSNKEFYREVSEWATTGKVYVNYWVNYDFVEGDDTWQFKADRLGATTVYSSRPQFARLMWFDTQYPTTTASNYLECYDSEANQLGGDINGDGDALPMITENNWVNVVFEYEMSTASTSDGNFNFYQSHPSGATAYAKRYWVNVQTNTGGWGSDIGVLKMGYVVENGGVECDSYFDNVYIDNSWARVEIGDNATYTNCTHREIQIPSAWSTTSITATINQGSFADSSTAYVFVVDEDGVTSTGYEVTFGSASPTSTGSTTISGTGTGSVTVGTGSGSIGF